MSAKVNIKTVRVAANGGGNQDITITGFGTPKAALFIMTNATADDSVADSATMCIGATDGTRQWVNYMRDLDGQATMTSIRGVSNARLIKLRTTVPGNLGEASFVSWITDGVRINWNVTASDAYLITVVLFGGTSLSAYANQSAFDNITINTVGFEANCVLTCSNGQGTGVNESTTTAAQMNFGCCTNYGGSVTNKGLFWQSRDNVATSEVSAILSSSKCTGRMSDTAFSIQVYLDTFNASGFNVNTDVVSIDGFGYLALKTGAGVNVQTVATPTVNGTFSVTGMNFKPQCVIIPFTRLSSVDSLNTTTLAEQIAMSTMDGTREYTNQISSEDNAADSNTYTKLDNKAVDTYKADSTTDLFDAQFLSMNSNGFSLTVNAQDGVGHYIMPISFGDSRVYDFMPFMTS